MTHEADGVCDALVALAVEHGIRCVMQIGAEDGYEAWYIRDSVGGRAVAIDGDPKTTPCTDDIEFYRCLIGPINTLRKFYVNEGMGLSTVIPRYDSMEQAIMAEQFTLDTICAMQDVKPDMLIIDTEGTALEVLSGGEETLKGVKVVYAEVQLKEIRPGVSLLTDVDTFLWARGFVKVDGPQNYEDSLGTQANRTWVRI